MQNTSAKRKHQARHQQDFIRKIRCAIGYHQDPQGFANLLGMSVSKLGRLERGEVRLKSKDKSKLAEVANIPERELEDFEPHAALGSQKSARIPAPSDHAPKAHDQLKTLREENVFLKDEVGKLHHLLAQQNSLLQGMMSKYASLLESSVAFK